VIDRSTVASKVAEVRSRISELGRDPASVTIVGVTKGFGSDAVRALVEAGIFDIGENYSGELLAKAGEMIGSGIRWHYLGTIQRRKVPALSRMVDCWETVSRSVEGDAIAARSPGAKVLLEVDFTGDAGRNGCRPADVPSLARDLQSAGLDVQGLMTVAPLGGDAGMVFGELAAMAGELGLPQCSMGMSSDFPLAIEHGATIIRLGRALLGDRPPRT